MITVKTTSLDDKPYPAEYIQELQEQVNSAYPTELELEITLINRETSESDELTHRAVLRYEEQCIIEDQQLPALDILKLVSSLAISQADCSHTYERKKNEAGIEIPTGVGVCLYCGYEKKDALKPIKGKHVAKYSCSSDVYVTEFDWEGVSIQCGGSGIVFSRSGNYKTAFFEAFPDVHGIGTFIRGEGADVTEAEAEAWKKYQARLNCKGHEWTRKVNGSDRTDGYAQCIHCKLTGTVLEPLTKCKVCDKPTRRSLADDSYVCVEHYYALSNLELVEDHMKIVDIWDSSDRLDDEAKFHKRQKDQTRRFASILGKRVVFEEMGTEFVEKNSSVVSHIGATFCRLVLAHEFDMGLMGRLEKYPEMDEAIYAKQIAHLRSNIKEIADKMVNKTEGLTSGHFINFEMKGID